MSFSQQKFNEVFGPAEFVKGNEAARLMVYVTYAGDPTTNVVPAHIGQMCFDTANAAFYISTSLLAAGWKKLTP